MYSRIKQKGGNMEKAKKRIQKCIEQGEKKLDLSSLHLTEIPSDPPIPDNLTLLQFNMNKLTSLPSLPRSLLHLFCSSNKLTSLPDLPLTLKEIYCSENNLETLPKLHNNLKVLSTANNKLRRLPILPDSLTHIYISHNKLKNISKLPDNLMILNCSSNKLTTLPEVPPNLQELFCEDNDLPDELNKGEGENMKDYIKRIRPIVKEMNEPSNTNKNKKRLVLGELKALPKGNNIGIESFPGGINYLEGKEQFERYRGGKRFTQRLKRSK